MKNARNEKTIYRETYNRGGAKIKHHLRPVLKHQANGFVVVDAYLLAAGSVERNGVPLEYQDIRVYLTDSLNRRDHAKAE